MVMTLFDAGPIDGRWWLPARGKPAGGRLAPNDTGFRLELLTALDPVSVDETGIVRGSMKWATHPIIHGTMRDGTQMTLFNVAGFSVPFEDVAETFTVDAVVSGYHFDGDEFSRAWGRI